MIAADKRKAAAIYNDVRKSRQPVEETLRILEDPNSKFSAVPEGTMRYAEFMSRVGSIRTKPARNHPSVPKSSKTPTGLRCNR